MDESPTPTTANRFQTGETYKGTFICNSDSHVLITITRRTEKSVWFKHPHGDGIVRRNIDTHDGNESFMPFGRYSMAMWIGAEYKV